MKNLPKNPLSPTLFTLRLISGVIGGSAGLLSLFVVYFLMQSLIPSQGDVGSLSVFAIIIMTFVGTLVANTLTAVMVTFMDHQKYSKRKTTILHIFIFNLILFFLTIPMHIIGIELGITPEIAATHFLLSAFMSAVIMEILAGYEYCLVGIYGAGLGIFISIGIAFALLSAGIPPIVIIFGAMPGAWLILQLVGGITEMAYDNYVKFYGVEALNTQTDLGGDNEKE